MGLSLRLILGICLLWRISDSLHYWTDIIRDSRLPLNLDLGLGLEQGTHSALLLGDEGHGLQLMLPLIGDGDGILSRILVADGISTGICRIYGLLYLIGVLAIPNVVEIGSVTLASLGELVGEIVSNKRLLTYIIVKMLDRNLVKKRSIDKSDLSHF